MNQFKPNTLVLIFTALLGLALPLSIFLSNYLFAVVMIILVIQSPIRKKIAWLPMFIMVIPLIIPLVSIFFHGETAVWSQLEVRLPFFVTAFVVSFFNINFDQLNEFKRGLILGTIIATGLFFLDNSIFQISKFAFIDLSYIPLFIVVSLIFLWYTDIEVKNYLKLIISLLIILVLALMANTFFIMFGLLIGFSAIIVKGSSMQSKLAIFLVVLITAFILYRGDELNEYIVTQNGHQISTTDKLAQWQCVLEVMQNKELFGIGFTNKEEVLMSCYHEHNMIKAEASLLNAHNEYLDFFLTLGYIGVLALLIYFINALFLAYDFKQVAHFLIISLIAMFSLTENIFTRQKGVMITSITYLLIYSARDFSFRKQDEQDENTNSTASNTTI